MCKVGEEGSRVRSILLMTGECGVRVREERGGRGTTAK